MCTIIMLIHAKQQQQNQYDFIELVFQLKFSIFFLNIWKREIKIQIL